MLVACTMQCGISARGRRASCKHIHAALQCIASKALGTKIGDALLVGGLVTPLHIGALRAHCKVDIVIGEMKCTRWKWSGVNFSEDRRAIEDSVR